MLTIKGSGKKINLSFTTDTTLEEIFSDIEKEKNFLKDADCIVAYSGKELSYDEEMLFEKKLKDISEKIVLEKKHRLSQEQILYSLESDERILSVIKRNIRIGET